MRKIVLFLAFTLISTAVWAGGYRVALQGVRQASLGNTSAMHVRDASVAFFNPAGIAFIDSKVSVAVGAFGIFGQAKYQNPTTGQTAETDNDVGTPFYAAVSYKPTEKLAVGLSVTTPFGNQVAWPENWSGNNLITSIELRSFFIQPTVAYKFSDWFSVGAGFIYSAGSVNLQRRPTVGNTNVDLELDDTDASGTGYNVGFFFKPNDKLNIGLAYRSKVDIDAEEGAVTWEGLPTTVSGQLPFTANQFDATLPLPAEFIAGFSYRLFPKLTFSGEVSLTDWDEYQSLDLLLTDTNTDTSVLSVAPRNYEDRAIWRAGLEYNATQKLDLRAGYYYDPFPSPGDRWSPETPSVNQHAFTGGLGYKFNNGFMIDAYGHYLYGEERFVNNIDTNFSGDVKTNTFIVGLGLSYNFGSFGSSNATAE